MNRAEKLGLFCILTSYFTMVGYKLEDETAPWYVMVFLILGCLVFLFGDEK